MFSPSNFFARKGSMFTRSSSSLGQDTPTNEPDQLGSPAATMAGPVPGAAPQAAAAMSQKPQEEIERSIAAIKGEMAQTTAKSEPKKQTEQEDSPKVNADLEKPSVKDTHSASTEHSVKPPVATKMAGPSTPAKSAKSPASGEFSQASAKAKVQPQAQSSQTPAKATSAADVAELPPQGKAAALVSGFTKAPAKASVSLISNAPVTSAAAVSKVTGQKPVSSLDRLEATGSVLATGTGAKAEPAAPKAKAKSAVPKPAAALTGLSSAPVKPPVAVSVDSVELPKSALNIVTEKRKPALDTIAASVSGKATVPVNSAAGPARIYTASAAPALAAASSIIASSAPATSAAPALAAASSTIASSAPATLSSAVASAASSGVSPTAGLADSAPKPGSPAQSVIPPSSQPVKPTAVPSSPHLVKRVAGSGGLPLAGAAPTTGPPSPHLVKPAAGSGGLPLAGAAPRPVPTLATVAPVHYGENTAQTVTEVPKVGPPAVAVGRSIENGVKQPVQVVNGKPVTPIQKKYQIVFVSGEVAPYSKTGGLGEAMDGLSIALAALGHRVMVIAPRYDQYKDAWDTSFWSSVKMGGKDESVHFFHSYKQKVDHVFIDHPTFLERVDGLAGSKLYGPEWGRDFADNQERFAYFCKAALVAVKDLPLGGYPYGDNVVVINSDWQSALVSMFIHAQRSADPTLWKDTKTIFLCHNAVFQGRFEVEKGLAKVFDVPQEYIDSITTNMPLKVGKYHKKVLCINTMAAGLRYSDRTVTVSPTYAQETSTDPEKGVELEELFSLGQVTGILNGVKEGVCPSQPSFVAKTKMTCGTYTPETAVVAKEKLKMEYRTANGLPDSPGPLMCFIGRLDTQKGYDLLLEALTEVLEECDIQVVVVGAGRADLVAQTKALEGKFPSKLFYAGWMGPERYALLGGCDYTLMPSRWEPCGLVQMEAMRLGTLPVVAPTGGLKDTVEDGINGLWIEEEMVVEAELDEDSICAIAAALRRAADIHTKTPQEEAKMKVAAMYTSNEFTWSNAALQYEAVFEELGVKSVLDTCKQKEVTLEVDSQFC